MGQRMHCSYGATSETEDSLHYPRAYREMRTPKQISSHINKLKSLYVNTSKDRDRPTVQTTQPLPPNFLAMMQVNRAIYGELSTHLKSKFCFDFVGDIDAI